MAFDPSKYTVAKARPLPVILMLDGSGSMGGEKIKTLNSAVNEMIQSFKDEASKEIGIQIGVIIFGDGGANYALPLQDVSSIENVELTANGGTPMGMALKMAKDLIEDKDIIPSCGYKPAVILVSDGAPNDSWQEPMKEFTSSGRSSKCDRYAMEIQAGQEGEEVLNLFLEGTENKIFHANQASKIKDFFRFVTMSVSVRSKSKNPNEVISIPELTNSSKSTDTSLSTESNKIISDLFDF